MSYKIIKEDMISSPNNKKHTLIDATVELPSGKQVIWQYFTVNHVVSIAALTNDHQIYIVRQWRPARNAFIWELPAGGINSTHPTNDDVISNANRELQEEIGIKADKIELVATCTPTSHSTGVFYATIATGLKISKLPEDENEDLEIKHVPFDEAWKLLVETQTPPAITLINLLYAKEYLRL